MSSSTFISTFPTPIERLAHIARYEEAREAERSIGIIPGLFRSAYRSAIRICEAIGREVLPERSAGVNESADYEPKYKKKSVYQLKGTSNMPGGWIDDVADVTGDCGGEGEGESSASYGVEGGDKGGDKGGNECLEKGRDGASCGGKGGDKGGKECLERGRDGASCGGVNGGKKPADEEGLDNACGATSKIFDAAGDEVRAANVDREPLPATPPPATPKQLPKTLLKFTCFPSLPEELRLKIWRRASRHERVIALEFVEDPYVANSVDRHRMLRMNARSRGPPLLYANGESRAKCRKLYKYRKFSDTQSPFFFNPSVDTLYLTGRTYCPLALSSALSFLKGDIPRIAIDISAPLGNCCWDRDWVRETMNALQGVGIPLLERSSHCQGLEEVMFVIESRPLAMIPTRFNPGVSFRPASTDGITEAQVALKEELEAEIESIMDENPSRFRGNAWVGDDKPTFSFVNLARDRAGEVFETISASRGAVSELKAHYTSFINELRQSTGCKIYLLHQRYDDEWPMEIGLKGTKEGVEVCRRRIQRILDFQF